MGEGLTSAIPTLLLLTQRMGGEEICVRSSNGTTLEPTFTQPRFSVTIFMFLIAGIIFASLLAFLLLRWTNLILLADAVQQVSYILKLETLRYVMLIRTIELFFLLYDLSNRKSDVTQDPE